MTQTLGGHSFKIIVFGPWIVGMANHPLLLLDFGRSLEIIVYAECDDCR